MPAFWLIAAMSPTGFTSTSMPFAIKYLAWPSQHEQFRSLYRVPCRVSARVGPDRLTRAKATVRRRRFMNGSPHWGAAIIRAIGPNGQIVAAPKLRAVRSWVHDALGGELDEMPHELARALEPLFRSGPGADQHELHVWPKLRERALTGDPFDERRRIRELRVPERDQRSLRPG